jgi:hypothetical protein
MSEHPHGAVGILDRAAEEMGDCTAKRIDCYAGRARLSVTYDDQHAERYSRGQMTSIATTSSQMTKKTFLRV